jgi:hypothetical protein
MHAFLTRQGSLEAFAHLHPMRAERDTFETPVPPLPAGRYHLFADVTHESGFTQTLVAEVDLPTPAPFPDSAVPRAHDPDDSWLLPSPAPPAPDHARASHLGDGLVMTWERPATMAARRETTLRFRVRDAGGRPAPLEPYLDMAAHAAIQHEDGTVFTHLHPFGTISMAAQQLFVKRENASVKNQKPLEIFCGLPPADEALTFPYEFPKPGRYRIWVQVRSGGRIRTGAFDADLRG